MREGQISKSFFCSWCGEPAVGREWNGERWWSAPCPHAAPTVRMGPTRRRDIVALYEARQEFQRNRQRQAIADCAGQPVDEIELVKGAP